MGKKTPKAPDPVATANAQSAVSKDTALWNASLNNVNQYTPYGNLTYTQGKYADGSPYYNATTTLSPDQQTLFNLGNKSDISLAQLGNDQIGRIQQSVSNPYSYEGLPSIYGEGDMNTARQRAEDAIMSRMNTQFGNDEDALRTRLANQGITQGSEAFNKEMANLNNAKTDARQQAILNGATYATNLLNNSLSMRNQGIQEYNAQRNAPLNEYSAFTSGTQVQNPTFQNYQYQGAQTPDLAGAIYNNYNSQVASKNNTMNGLFGLGGMALGTAGGKAGWTSLFK